MYTLGEVNPDCISKSNCEPKCVKFFADMYGLQIPNFNYTGAPGTYQQCMKYDGCKPQCISSFKNNSVNSLVALDSRDVVANQVAINQGVASAKTKTVLIVGGVLAVAAAIIIFTK